jgi:O-antigen/teichoic acid export membrane protein
MFPLHALNLNMLNVQGRSDLILKLEIIKKILAIPIILIGIWLGIIAMIIGLFIHSLIAFFINSYWSGKFINYSMWEQISDILPSFLLAASSSFIVYLIGSALPFGYLQILIIQIFSGAILIIVLCEITQLKAYLFMKEIIQAKIIDFKNAPK